VSSAASKTYSDALVEPTFTASQLYSKMLNPTVKVHLPTCPYFHIASVA
jgi:hypothetical protein